jgi:hypothetical protein
LAQSCNDHCGADWFDGFNGDTGTIENADGEREICPYLA